MARDLMDLLQVWQDALLPAFIIFLRVGTILALMPGFGEQTVPVRVRLLLSIMFTMVVVPMLAGQQWFQHILLNPTLFLTEVVSGLLIGIFFRMFVFALQVAGTIAAQATSLSQIFGGGATPDPMPAFGSLFVIGGLTLAMMPGLHVKVAIAIARSYDLLPAGHLPARSDVAQWGVIGISHIFSMAFSLAAPFVLASLIYNVALGAINKAMPQLMVAFIGAPAITLGGLILLAISTPLILMTWLTKFNMGLADPFGRFW